MFDQWSAFSQRGKLIRAGPAKLEPKGVAALFALFKPKVERDLTRREEEAAAAVAYDYTRRTSRTVLRLIDSYRDEKVVPLAANALKAFRTKLSLCGQDENFDRVVELQAEFEETVKRLSQAAVTGVWHGLSEWHFTLTGSALKAELDRYIALTFGNIWEHIGQKATNEANSVIARIAGERSGERLAPLDKANGSVLGNPPEA